MSFIQELVSKEEVILFFYLLTNPPSKEGLDAKIIFMLKEVVIKRDSVERLNLKVEDLFCL